MSGGVAYVWDKSGDFESKLNPVEGVSAATILGCGRIALILDAHALLRRVTESRATLLEEAG